MYLRLTVWLLLLPSRWASQVMWSSRWMALMSAARAQTYQYVSICFNALADGWWKICECSSPCLDSKRHPNATADWDFEDIMDLLEDSIIRTWIWMLEDAGSEFWKVKPLQLPHECFLKVLLLCQDFIPDPDVQSTAAFKGGVAILGHQRWSEWSRVRQSDSRRRTLRGSARAKASAGL